LVAAGGIIESFRSVYRIGAIRVPRTALLASL